ncbi:MAG: hypothetical protein V2I47_10660 [Bacteroidales bacterium]|jgi:hypothetical protein|nr:hypothetical protein [Bacteroidales bacterium]
MKKLILYSIFIILAWGISFSTAYPNDDEPGEIYMEFTTWKYNDMSRSLIAKLSSDNDDGEYFVRDIPVQFYLTDGEENLILGEAVSDNNGIAELNIPDGNVIYPMDEEGYIYFTANYPGGDRYLEVEEELMVKDVSISLSLEDGEDGKFIYFKGVIHGPEEDWPLADDDLYFYVPRMFSDMKIADGWFEEDGTGFVEFPTTVVGDSVGNVLVKARLFEHYDYGNVEVTKMVNWARPKRLISAEKPVRELWTPIAPLWMIITLIIMLTGVWAHYIYAIIQLILIKRSKNK